MSELKAISLGVMGVKARADARALTITSESPLRVLSSAVLNGGRTAAMSIMNYHVPKSFDDPEPAALLEKAATKLRLPGPTVGLMTAARIRNFSVMREEDEGVATIITAGMEPAAAAGDTIKSVERPSQGTINTILVIDRSLTEGAMVEAVKTATEAKTLALRDLDLRSRFSSEAASGTITDSVCVACTGRGKNRGYAGTGTGLGQAMARCVRRGVGEAILKENGLIRNRPVIQRLGERGIRFDDLVLMGMELFVGSGAAQKSRATALLRRGLMKAASDPNVSSLLVAAMRLDEDGSAGALPELAADDFMADPINLIADETLGIAIANYIAGTAGMHNFLYYDRMKPGVARRLGPFMDDAVCGLVAGVMSKVLREES